MLHSRIHNGFLIGLASLVLAACGAGSDDEPNVPAPTPSNRSPLISGVPATQATAGSQWSFQPTASDPDGDALTFSISAVPSGTAFNSNTGALSGSPATGTYNGIMITVSDGRGGTASLAPFTLTVVAVPATSSINLTWDAPTLYSDGSAMSLMDLAGYRIYHGTRADQLAFMADVSGAATSTYRATSLSSGQHFFAVTTVSVTGAESSRSVVVNLTLP
jgi:hypothetical protein